MVTVTVTKSKISRHSAGQLESRVESNLVSCFEGKEADQEGPRGIESEPWWIHRRQISGVSINHQDEADL